jgi:RsiW-degrading membrane proteinase PrsW (M82 family)
MILSIVVILSCCIVSFAHCGYYFNNQASHQQPLSGREFRHVVGTSAVSVLSIGYFLAGLAIQIIRDLVETHTYWYHNTLLYIWISFSTIALLVPTWLLFNKLTKLPITFSFVMSMFWGGAIFSIIFSGILNTILMIAIWPRISPDCNIGQVMMGTGIPPSTQECLEKQWFQWVFTPGLVEEGLKFAVLLTIRTNLQEIVSACWLTRCLRSSQTPVPCCAWMLKLATSPSSIVIAGIAAGGGFASLENVQYVSKIMAMAGNEEDPWAPSIRVRTAFMHMLWTGIIAIVFAVEKFLAPKAWSLKFVAYAASMCLHGTFNCFATFGELGAAGQKACDACDASNSEVWTDSITCIQCHYLGDYRGWEGYESRLSTITIVLFSVLMVVFALVIEPKWQRSLATSAPGVREDVEMQSSQMTNETQ